MNTLHYSTRRSIKLFMVSHYLCKFLKSKIQCIKGRFTFVVIEVQTQDCKCYKTPANSPNPIKYNTRTAQKRRSRMAKSKTIRMKSSKLFSASATDRFVKDVHAIKFVFTAKIDLMTVF